MASEKEQINLIKLEFESQGYTVYLERSLARDSDGTVDRVRTGSPLVLDIQAERESNEGSELVVVEIVNREGRGLQRELLQRAEMISQRLQVLPNARLEFRYLDTTEAEYRRRRGRSELGEVRKDLAVSLIRRSKGNVVRTSETAMADWWRWSRGLRALAPLRGIDATDDLLVIVESLVEQGVLPPTKATQITYGQMHEALLSTIEGQTVSFEIAERLRKAVQMLRRRLHRQPG